MTPYTRTDLAEDWEFKIIRSTTGTFKKPEKMRAVLDEEACAGWVMVEAGRGAEYTGTRSCGLLS